MGLAYGAALALEHISGRRGFLPPLLIENPARRWAARIVLTGILWLLLLISLPGLGGEAAEPSLADMSPLQLFLLHALLVASILAWMRIALGRFELGRFAQHLGLSSRLRGFLKEAGVGLAGGIAAWVVTLATLLLVALGVSAVAGEDAISKEPPALIPFIAGLPVWIRLSLAASAGVVEEIFFRGFLQPRMGVVLSTAFFVVAHAGYQNPIMLVGVTLLSLIFAGLVVWRRNVWAAVVAHFVFDAVQLLFVVPWLLDKMPGV